MIEKPETIHAAPGLEKQNKRKNPSEEVASTRQKKVRLEFAVDAFRREILTENKSIALQKFFVAISETSDESILSYLSEGGSPLEILQLMEIDSTLSPVLIFQIANEILLQIIGKHRKFEKAASEAIRYILNTFVTVINKMLGLSSSGKERLVVLKLLTTIVTFSAVSAKDVLLHVNFNPTNLKLLTKSGGKNEVRDAFVHFMTAFLVDGHYQTLSVLLEKRGLLTSIVEGLRYDKADSVVLVITAMKNHILENSSVSKTVKMKTFSTPVIKQIVNLYNWRGPGGMEEQKSENAVNELDKSKVSEAVHAFLLTLCTSHKFGVIFKDNLVGLGKRNQNSLVYTVIESLERPWEHSYAGDLVIKTCTACPDLIKTVWHNLTLYLEPRATSKWINAMNFAEKLLDQVHPGLLEDYIADLTNHQIVQILTVLATPVRVLKTIILPEYDKQETKYRVLRLLQKMTSILVKFLEKAEILEALAVFLNRNFPNSKSILSNWDQEGEYSISDYLEVAFDLLDNYKVISPQLIDPLNLDGFLRASTIEKKLQIKAVDLFLDMEPQIFVPQKEIFENIVSVCFQCYYEDQNSAAASVLHKLFQNTGIFDGFETEIDIWIDGILNVKHFNESVTSFVVNLIKLVYDDIATFNQRLFQLKNANFSALFLALNKNEKLAKSIRAYLEFVVTNVYYLQVDATSFLSLNDSNFINDPSYKGKGAVVSAFRSFFSDFIQGNIEAIDLNVYPNFKLNLLQAAVFHLTKLMRDSEVQSRDFENFLKLVEIFGPNLDGRCARVIFSNPVILQNLTVLESPYLKFMLSLIAVVKSDKYFEEFREKIFQMFSKIFRKPEKFGDVSVEMLEVVHLDYDHCFKLMERFVANENGKFFKVASYCLNRMAVLARNNYSLTPLPNETLLKLSQIFSVLIKENTHLSTLSEALLAYLKVFPHNLEGIQDDLFVDLIKISEYNKDNVALSKFLLVRKSLLDIFEKHLDEICTKRGVLLSHLDAVHDEVLLKKIFVKFEPQILKALQKPHKAGQHFHTYYKSVGALIKYFNAESFFSQTLKFETCEFFHVYLLAEIGKNEKNLSNVILTFVHLLVGLLKQRGGSKPLVNFKEICEIVRDFLFGIENNNIDLIKNETFQLFCKLCLKYGVAGDFALLEILGRLVYLCLNEEESGLVLDLMLAHSNFLDTILGDCHCGSLVELWRIVVEKSPKFMDRSHVPLLLSAYRATRSSSDQVILKLLKLYESAPDKTSFFDFKPFLWGRAAVSYYSIRSDVEKVLWKQPKMSDVLNNLDEPTIQHTITNPDSPDSYDLDFFLPLFSHILSPESPVQTYIFIRSGALALTIIGLRGEKPQRLAACHVLSRFYFHLEARQSGKDNLLWLRFIEAVCKGTAVLDDFKINNFVGVYLARTAQILSRPTNVMYVPLSRYLAAKDALDFSTIPELYTLLHSPDVNSKDHKRFILEVLRDGLRSDKDFTTFLSTMGFKLISELCSSSVCDVETKVLILEVFKACCENNLGCRVLCTNLSFLTQIFGYFIQNQKDANLLSQLLEILLVIVQKDGNRHNNFLIYVNLMTLHDRGLLENDNLKKCFKIVNCVFRKFPDLFTKKDFESILSRSGDKFCMYLRNYGCRYVKNEDFVDDLYLLCLAKLNE